MFGALSLITDAILPPQPGQAPLEPIRRPSTSHLRASSFKMQGLSRPQSIAGDITLSGLSRSSSRPASALGFRARPRVSQRDTMMISSLKRKNTIISETEELQLREKVYRWDGIIGSRSEWDCIRRDQELWTPEGDALVHFYAQGQSRRGPSIRLSFSDIEACDCEQMLAESLVRGTSAWELYLPAPRRLDRAAAFRHHLTTRNLFAWMFDRPLVGSQLGSALVELHLRLDSARDTPAQNAQDMLTYIESQGYADFRDNPDHALGMLVYAEHFQLSDLWTDAFVHCAGQYDQLSECLDWPSVSLTSKALLARATCEMTVRLDRASGDLTSFMEHSMTQLDLAEDVRRHLDRFRSFLHSYYVQAIGYWPPNTETGTLPKSMLRSMYGDFRSLYELLADTEPVVPYWGGITSGTTNSSIATTKIDVPALVRSYDHRFRHNPLPYARPLLPGNIPAEHDGFFASMFFPNFGAPKRARIGRRAAAVSALQSATNAPTNPAAAAAPLVRAYREFERTTTLSGEERLSPSSARAARWLLIYAALQTLADVTRAPPEVRDPDGVSYPLCCQTAGTPPWSTTVVPEVAELDGVEPEVTAEGTQAHRASPVPSAIVAPLDLEAVANKRRSHVVPSSSTAQPPLLHSPKPRRPNSSGALAALEAYSSDEEQNVSSTTTQVHETEATPSPTSAKSSNDGQGSVAGTDDVPSLSPTSERHSRHSSRSSTDGASTNEELETPRSAMGSGEFDAYFGKNDQGSETERLFDAPPSPSIYEDAIDGNGKNKSEFDLLSVGKENEKITSEELAARWRGEIGI